MNVSLISLHALRIVGSSPFISGRQTSFSCLRSDFSHFYSSFTYLSNIKSVQIHQTRFTHFLATPLTIDSKRVYGKIYNESTRFEDAPNLTIKRCQFVGCKQNGALNVRVARLCILQTLFNGCDSINDSNAPVFTAYAGLAIINGTCIHNCNSNQANYSFIMKSESTVTYVNNILCKTPAGGYFEGISKWQMNNYSLIDGKDGGFLLNQTTMSYCTFMNNDVATMINIYSGDLIQYTDFVNCNCSKQIIGKLKVRIALEIRESLFWQSGPIITKKIGKIDFIKCAFDDFVNVPNIDQEDCIFNITEYAFHVKDPLSSDQCWNPSIFTMSPVPFKFSFTSVSFIFMCIIIFAIYVFMRHRLNQPVPDDRYDATSDDWNEKISPSQEVLGASNDDIHLNLDESDHEDTKLLTN